MANCRACQDLKDNAPEFVVNGVTTNVCTSLKNNTGLNPGNSNDDCEDTADAIDCLVTNMADEVEAYDVCDWKDFMKKFIPNLSNVLHVIRCTVCGVWAKIKALEDKVTALIARVDKHDCEINYLFEGDSFSVGEDESAGSYVVAGKGVSYLTRKSKDFHTTDVRITYIGGGLSYIAGGLEFFPENFVEPSQTKVYNFDETDSQGNPRHSYNRKKNDWWITTASTDSRDHSGEMVSGGELMYEIRIKKDQYPQLKQLVGLFGQEANIGGFHCRVQVFDGDKPLEGQTVRWAYGQHGSCNDDGTAPDDGRDRGHEVPKGWIYLQLRMTYTWGLCRRHNVAPEGQVPVWVYNSRKATPIAIVGTRFTKGNIPC